MNVWTCYREIPVNITPSESLRQKKMSHKHFQMCLLGGNEIIGTYVIKHSILVIVKMCGIHTAFLLSFYSCFDRCDGDVTGIEIIHGKCKRHTADRIIIA